MCRTHLLRSNGPYACEISTAFHCRGLNEMKPIPTTQRLLRFSRRTAVRYCALGVAVFVIGYLATCSLRGDNSMATKSLPQEEITALRPVAAVLNEGTHPSVNATETQIKGKTGPPFQFRQAQFINETHGWAMTLYSLYRTTDGDQTWEPLSEES